MHVSKTIQRWSTVASVQSIRVCPAGYKPEGMENSNGSSNNFANQANVEGRTKD
jgi:hypothetical protein